ncbi:hypothetical protein TNCT_402961 [Trichonephila clavata]|uniref:Uncharacterized protein n=1 Tax=Trichonephila clavata TaxID=2740835 RepID=A0A8X6GZT1_TRICU|nr:hypothetical protein TNCT_402961 [Trichonephila clavata]
MRAVCAAGVRRARCAGNAIDNAVVAVFSMYVAFPCAVLLRQRMATAALPLCRCLCICTATAIYAVYLPALCYAAPLLYYLLQQRQRTQRCWRLCIRRCRLLAIVPCTMLRRVYARIQRVIYLLIYICWL